MMGPSGTITDMVSPESWTTFEKRSFDNTMAPISDTYRRGLIFVALFAMLSLTSVSALLAFITYRLLYWRRHYKRYVGYNQYVILIYNLLLADLLQSIAFTITFRWLRLDKIAAATAACFVQGWFLHIGDIASGLFVFSIAVHTWLGVVKGYRMPYTWFVVWILLIWLLAVVLTCIGPAMYGKHYFARAGGWCWVSPEYEAERLWLHYLWIFICEFGSIAIYGHVFFHLRGRLKNILNGDTAKLTRATKFMILYPAAYVLLTLPISIGRMISMSGGQLPEAYFCTVGALLTSCGWTDALLYTLTRRVFIGGDISGHQYNRTGTAGTTGGGTTQRPGDDYGLASMSKDMGTSHTVTIVGGSNHLSRLVDQSRSKSGLKPGHSDSLSSLSETGSRVSMVKPAPNTIGIFTETDIHVESAHDSVSSDLGAGPSFPAHDRL